MPIPGEKVQSSNGKAPASKVVPSARSNQPVPVGAETVLTKRGGVGLLRKLTDDMRARIVPNKVDAPKITRTLAKHRIAPDLQQFAVPLDQLVPDPMNARTHDKQNLDAIKASLIQYGQVTPIVVQEGTNIIIAGNGRYVVAKELEWPDIAVHFVAMSKVEAAGFGLADNRTAELADWDLKMFAAVDLLLQEAGHETIGWTEDELVVLRAAEWITPTVDPNAQFGQDGVHTLKMSEEEKTVLDVAIGMIRERDGKELSEAQCLVVVCNEWLIPPHEETEDERADRERLEAQIAEEDALLAKEEAATLKKRRR